MRDGDRDAAEPAFVVSLLLSDADSPDDLVVGVRRANAQSDRHPGVLSTPTQRIPAALFAACQPQSPSHWPTPTRPGAEPTVVELDGAGARILPVPVGGPGTSASALGFAVETLLCRKLGLTEPLAAGRIAGTATPAAIAAGHVDDAKATEESEATVMLTVRVVLGGLRESLPGGTAFLDPLLVCPSKEFVRAVEQNDALLIDPALDPFEVCIGGLCVTSGAALLRGVGAA